MHIFFRANRWAILWILICGFAVGPVLASESQEVAGEFEFLAKAYGVHIHHVYSPGEYFPQVWRDRPGYVHGRQASLNQVQQGPACGPGVYGRLSAGCHHPTPHRYFFVRAIGNDGPFHRGNLLLHRAVHCGLTPSEPGHGAFHAPPRVFQPAHEKPSLSGGKMGAGQ